MQMASILREKQNIFCSILAKIKKNDKFFMKIFGG